MNIQFTGQTKIGNDLEFSFQALADEVSVICVVAGDALQDIDPEYANSGAQKQYENSQSILEGIARDKILKKEKTDNKIIISTIDVAKYKNT